jgi:hypothetical protein
MKKFTGIVLLHFLFISCKNVPDFPLEPVIKFNNLSFLSSTNSDKFALKIDFTDGDGNLGLEAGDTLSPYNQQLKNGIVTNSNYYNIFITFLFKKDSVNFDECKNIPGCLDTLRENMVTIRPSISNEAIDTLLGIYNGRFPKLSEDDKKRPIFGTLEYDIQSTTFAVLFKDMTLKIKTQIQDRELNKSNIIISDSLRIP